MSQANDFLDGKVQSSEIDGFLGPEPVKPAGALRRLGDLGVSAARGIVGVPEAAVGMADLVTGGYAGKLVERAGVRFKDAKDIIGEYYSPEQKAASEAVNSAKGFMPTVAAMVENPSTILNAAVESAPSMIAGGAVSRGALAGAARFMPQTAARMAAAEAAPFVASPAALETATRAPIIAGVIGEGAAAAGQNAEQVRQESPDGLLTAKQSAILAASGVLTGGIGYGAGRFANKLGIGDAQTMLATGRLGAVGDEAIAAGANKGAIRKIGEGFLNEGVLQELPQSYQEQVAQNLAQGKPWDEGAASAGAQGMLAGALMGGVAGGLHGKDAAPVADTPVPAPEDPAAGPTLQLGNTPDPLIGFPDGTVARRSEADAYVNSLPADQQPAARAKLMGLEPQPVVQEQTPSQSMGLDPTAGPLSAAAVTAVDTGAHQSGLDTQAAQSQEQDYAQASAADQARYDMQLDEQNTSNKAITSGAYAEAQMTPEDRHAVLFSNQSVADGGRRYEGTQDGDVLNGMGAPFSTPLAARRRAQMEGKDWTIAPVFDGYVARRKDSMPEKSGNTPIAPVQSAQIAINNVANETPNQGETTNVPQADQAIQAEAKQQTQGAAATAGVADAEPVTPVTQPAQPVTGEGAGASQPTQVAATKPGPASLGSVKADMDHLFGVDQKRAKALTRIADGKAWFGNEIKAKQFVTQNGLKDTHEVKMTKPGRFDVVAKVSTSKQAPAQTNTAPAATETVAKDQNEADWTRMRDVDRGALAARAGLNPVQVKKAVGQNWENMGSVFKSKIEKAMNEPLASATNENAKPAETPAQSVLNRLLDLSSTQSLDNMDAATHDVDIGFLKALHDQLRQVDSTAGLNALRKKDRIGYLLTAIQAKETGKGGIGPKPVSNTQTADATATPAQADRAKKNEGLHMATGRADFEAGKPRTLPSYYTKPGDKNSKDWYRGWDAANAAAPVSNTQAEPAKPYRPSKEASSAWNAALERYALRNYHESGPEQRAAFGEGYMRAFDGVGSNPSAKHIAAHVDGVLFYERIAKDAPSAAAPAKGLGEQLAKLNAELERQGPVQNANTRAQRDSIRKQIATEDFPEVLKAVDDNIDVAEELNSAFKFAGDEPKAKTIARILKKRGITPEYQARWTERLMGEQPAKPGAVNVPPAVAEAFTAQMQKQKARITRLKNEADKAGSLEDKKAAQLKVTASEATLRQMRLKIFDAEDAAVRAVEAGNAEQFADFALLFPDAEAAINQLTGQNDELDAEMQSYEAKPNPTYSGKPKKEPKAPETQETRAPAATETVAVKANTVFTEDAAAAARARLKAKLSRLNTGVDPEMLMDGIILSGYHIEKGARTFVAYASAMIDDLGDGVKPYLKSWYMASKYDPRMAGMDGLDDAATMDAVNLDKLETPEPAKSGKEGRGTLTAALTAEILSGKMPKDNPALKKLVEAFDGKPADQNRMKEAQEALESAIVNVSRAVVAKNEGPRSTFDSLLRLYESQPNLNIRTSTSIANQAYSTPAPLAYLGSVLADVTAKTTMYEPTAGNGMLTINALPGNVTVNELEANRIDSLKSQGFKQVLEGDAVKADVPAKSQDRVVTNPPFGSIKDSKGEATKISVDGYKIGQIDHLIAARALETMRDDGKATLIIGANKVSGGLNTDDRIFFNWLYGNYNVTSHFEVDGDLYQRQGAGWPVRVITISGRVKSDRVSPVAGTIQRAQNWEQVYEQFTASLDSSRAEPKQGAVTSAGGTSTGQAGAQPVRGSTVKPDSKDGGRGQAGSPVSTGNVSGASAGNGADSSKPAADKLGARDSGQRLNAEPVESDRLDPAGDAVIAAPAKPAGNPRATALSSAENQFQVTYEPRSARKDGGVLIPVNMKDPTQDALSRLEDAVGDIDAYAAKELGYKSVKQLHEALMGLQVDSVASAIYQIEQGKGVVIADQTGIGKGRQAAAVIRWAERSGYIPVFVSVKPSLFTDMFGDLHDIGSDNIAPFILNKDESIKGPGDTKLFANKALTHKRNIENIRDTGKLPDDSNAIFMTYSQINTDNVQRQMLTALADRAVFILDESHNAGGQSNTGEFMISLLEGAKGVTYLSATYAKRPDNMPLYFKTDIGQAAADNEGLMQAMASGGLPLQTVVSNNLVKAGQMFRRERSYDGVSIETIVDTEHRTEHEKLSDETTRALRAIVSADRMFHHVFVKQMNEDAKSQGAAVIDNAGNQAQAGVDHTQFSSVVHNFVKQMLLGLKAQRAADEAIAALKDNRKPIIAVENTMGSFLEAYAKDNMVTQGGSLGSFDYRTVLSRALARTLFLTEVTPTGDKVKREIKLSELDAETRAAYDNAQQVIDGLKLDIPVSPIDWIRNEIRKAGFTVAEITGRKLAVDYSEPGKATLGSIDALEQTDKVRTTQLFNSGRLDALILNVAGSTGISLHASEKFTDQRQRHMIVAQAAGDINIFMQMLGRIHRTGQVVLPGYGILSVDLPTEKRPTAVLSGKMKSLNANTSSNTDSATSIKTVDMFNKYGDQVVAQYLRDNYQLARDLGVEDIIGGDDATEDLAQKATGRLALQPIAVQNSFYDEVEGQYSAMMEYLNKTNQNDLEPRTFDFDAQETRSEVLFDGPNKETPFGEDAVYGEYSIKAQGKAMTPAEIREAINTNLDGKKPDQHMQAALAPLVKQFDDYIKTLEGPSRDSANAARAAGQAFMVNHSIGDTFRVDINGDSFNAVVTNIRNTHKANGNPFSLSKIQVTIALNGALRSISVPASQFQKIEVSSIGRGYTVEQLFKEQPANQRETAKIVTGNLLAAYGELQGVRGTIITFTKQDGTTEQGILLPKAFDFTNNTRGDYHLATGAQALQFLQYSQNKDISRFGIMSRDGIIRVLPAGQGVTVVVPKSKLKGGKYFLDKGLIGALGEFVSSGSFMKATENDPAKATQALDLLMKKGALYALPSMAEEAKAMVGDAPAASRVKFSRGAQGQATGAVESKVAELTANWENKPNIVVAFDMQDERIPERVRMEDQKQRSGGATGTPEGFYYKGTVYLMSSKLATDKDIARVLYHEALGHYGLRSVYGKSLKIVLSKIATFRKAEVAAKMEQYGLKGINSLDRMTAAEEVLAEMAQDTPSIGLVREAVAAVRTWLRENVPGFKNLNMTDDEIIRSYILPARAWVEKGGPDGGGGGLPAMSRAEQADSPAFRKWFGDSKVVDPDGKPLLVYHGTGRDFTEFDTTVSSTTRANGNTTGTWGAYFSPSAKEASIYAEMSGGDQTVIPAYLSLQNPYVMNRSEWRKETMAANKGGRGVADATRSRLEESGHDGIVVRDRGFNDEWVAFHPTQIKSAIGNNGDFDSENPDIRFSRSAVLQQVGDKLNETLNHPGNVSKWHTTVGSMYNLAERSPAFKRVFDAAQGFLNDVSYYATEAADMAPKILPKLENWRDIGKSPISYADNKAISAPIFEGTLGWARDEQGKPIRIEDMTKAAEALSIDQKSQRLLRGNKISEGVLKMWRGLPIEQYESMIEGSYEKNMLRPGVVWTDKELASMFKLNPAQIGLYQEFRKGIDTSIDNAAKAGMLRTAGKDAADMAQMVMDSPDVDAAGILLRDHFLQMADENPERSTALIESANGMMDQADKASKLKAEGYAPLSRFGQYSVDVVVNGERQEFRMFEDKRSSNQFAAQMRGKYGTASVSQSTMSQKEFEQFQGVTPETMELFGNMLGLNSTGNEASDQVFQKYLKMTKANRSAMKRLIHRKGTAGYSEDVGRVLAAFITSNARHTAGALNLGELGDSVNDIPKGQGELKDVAIKLQKYVTQPEEEAQAIRGLMFAQYLGGSVASAMVNLTQPMTVSFPYLSQFGGAKQSGAQLVQAYKDMANKAFKYEPGLAKALHTAEEQGVVSPQEVHQLQAQARGAATLHGGDGTKMGDAMAKGQNVLAKLSMGWGKLFGIAEQINRRSTFIAAYRIGIAQKVDDPAAFASKAVNETQFINNRGNKMQWGRGAVGATLMTFKSYSFNWLELFHRMATQSGPEGKKAAALMVAMLFLSAGAGGLPFADDLDDLLDFIGQKLGYNLSSNKAKQQFLEDVFGKAGAQFVDRGLTGLPGSPIDVSGRMSMGNLIPATGLLLDKRDSSRDVQELLGPIGDMAKRAGQSAGALVDGDFKRALLAAAPRAITNLAQGADMADKGYYADAKGYKVLDTSPAEAAFKAIGFQPQSVSSVQESNGITQRMKEGYSLRAQDIRSRWAKGIFEKDADQVQTARDMLKDWNDKNPDQRMIVDLPSVWKKVREMAKPKDQRIAETAPKAMRVQLKRELLESRE